MLPPETARRTAALTLAVWRYATLLGWHAVPELVLPDGRRADLFAIDQAGRLIIVEVKSGVVDFRSDAKWPDYLGWSDELYFAVATDFPQAILPEIAGIIVADSHGAEVIRPAPQRPPLASARRRALVLLMARIAASRLKNLADPGVIETTANPVGFTAC